MLKLNVNQEKQLTFEVQIGGVQSEQVSSHLRIMIDEIEYGFAAEIGRESITVNLPPLRTVTARKLKEGEEVQVKLEIIADGNYLTPWQDTFRLSNPLVVEAKIVDDDFNPAPAFKTKLVQEGKHGDQKQGVRLEKIEESTIVKETNEEDLTERIVNKLAEKLSSSFGKAIKEQDKEGEPPSPITKPEGEDKDEVYEEKIKESSRRKPTKKISPKDLLNITEEGVYAYMQRAGTKNPKIQKLVYEQAEAAAGSSRPVDVLKQVVKLLKVKK
jgi:hypothetical protein